MSLLSFLEKIDLECNEIADNVMNKKALRLDGKGKDGLRGQLGLGDQNCCDYLLPKDNKLILIEISDFIKQLQKLQTKYKEVPKDCKSLVQDAQKIMRREVKLKVLSSLIVLFKLPVAFQIAHETIHKKQLEIIFVVCSNKPEDVLEFEYLTTEISGALNPLIRKIKIVDISMFQHELTRIRHR